MEGTNPRRDHMPIGRCQSVHELWCYQEYLVSHSWPGIILLTVLNTHLSQSGSYECPLDKNVRGSVLGEGDQIMGRFPGMITIHDYIAICGRHKEHNNANLLNLMVMAGKNGLVFTSSICEIRWPSSIFCGCQFTDTGIEPDPTKIQGLLDMPMLYAVYL